MNAIRPCLECGELTRSARSSIEDFPGTLRRATKEFCERCRSKQIRSLTKVSVEKLPQYRINDFWNKVEKGPNCWNWTGTKSSFGYGIFSYRNTSLRAHRVSYELVIGKIPDDLVIDHLCRNRLCVNPAHLEAVESEVNVDRGIGLTARNSRKSECSKGHPFDEINTYIRPGTSWRSCRKCKAEASRKSCAKRRKARRNRESA